MKKLILPLAMAFALTGFAPAFADEGTGDDKSAPTTEEGTAPTTPDSGTTDDGKKDDGKGSTGPTTEPEPAPAPDEAPK